MNLFGGILHPGLASVLETALDAVCIMDSSGTVTGWNRRAEKLFGWSNQEAIGQRLSKLIIPSDLRPAHEKGLAHYLATGEGPVLDHRIEVSALNRNGEEFPVELSITASEQFGDLLFIGFVRDISDRKAAVERQQRQLQESDHRVKNMLTVVNAIARQTALRSSGLDEFMPNFAARLDALAEAHSLLTGKKWHDVALGTIAGQALSADVAAGRARYGGPEVLLPAAQVLGLSMILHELYTNAIKYGALCNDEGRLSVDWTAEDDEIELVWRETGPTCPSRAPKSGFGLRMIEMVARADLGGTIERHWTEGSLIATLRFPLSA